MIICSFSAQEDEDQFAKISGIIPSNKTFNIPMSLIKLAEQMNGNVSEINKTIQRYLVKIDDLSTVSTPHTLVSNEGTNGKFVAGNKNYWMIETLEGLSLFKELNGNVEQIDVPIKLLTEINSNGSTITLPEGYDWARLRLISRYRPFVDTFTLAETTFTRKPNLVIMDSGINFNHVEFEGLTCENLYALPNFNNDFADTAGHGTAVASYACGKNVGVHRYLNLLNVKIFDVNFKPNAIELGFALDACLDKFLQDPSVPMIINCSWTVAKNTYLEDKFQDLISAGIVVVAAAGNVSADVDFLTPAGMTSVTTVAASDIDDVSAGFNNFSTFDIEIQTNYGQNIDIFAPGVEVYGAYYKDNNSYIKPSGTSISAGFVSGCMAAILAQISGAFRQDAMNILDELSTKGVLLLDNEKFTFQQNKLAYLISAENAKSFKNYAYYLGLANQTIELSAESLNPVRIYSRSTNEEFTHIIEYDNDYGVEAFNTITSEGYITINPPILSWNPDEKIRLISFVVKSTTISQSITYKSPKMIYFAVNPDVETSLDSEVITALENINNQSFFAAWVPVKVGSIAIK